MERNQGPQPTVKAELTDNNHTQLAYQMNEESRKYILQAQSRESIQFYLEQT